MRQALQEDGCIAEKLAKENSLRSSPTRKRVRAPRAKQSKLDVLFERISEPASLSPNQSIFSKGQAAENLYMVKTGCIRTLSDRGGGRRRIHAFYFPGEYFGVEVGEQYSVSAETVAPSSMCVVKRATLARRAARDFVAANLLLRMTTMELQHTQNLNILLLKGAHERLVDFLHEVQRRSQSPGEINLPMPRSDIADYLDLTIETVSRAITQLKNNLTISMLTHRRLFLRGSLVPG